MPKIEIRNNGMDGAWLLAIATFPNDENLRRNFYTIMTAQQEYAESRDIGSVEFSSELIGGLIEATSSADMNAQVVRNTKLGFVAGDFLVSIFAMHSFPNSFTEPSIRKAVEVSRALARSGRFGDKSRMPTSETAIRKCFNEFRSVAHLWGALRLNQAYAMRPFEEVFASAAAVDDFLGIAGLLQDFGCWFIPKRAKPKKPLLELQSTWTVPNNARRLAPPWTEAPPWLVSTVEKYQA